MVKLKMKWQVVVLSILIGLTAIVGPFLNSSFAKDGNDDGDHAEKIMLYSGEDSAKEVTVKKSEEKNSTEAIAPQSGVVTVESLQANKSTDFNKRHNKERIKTENLPSSIDITEHNHSTASVVEEKTIEVFDEYILGPEDRLKINVFGENELTGDYRVGSDGTIAFPLIGDIKVENLTLRQAEEAIKVELRKGYLKKPSVSMEVLESRPFYILGEVRRPGSYNYISGMSVLQAVAISGGFTYRANRKRVEILRGNEAPAKPMDATPGEKVKPGDIIFIQERFF